MHRKNPLTFRVSSTSMWTSLTNLKRSSVAKTSLPTRTDIDLTTHRTTLNPSARHDCCLLYKHTNGELTAMWLRRCEDNRYLKWKLMIIYHSPLCLPCLAQWQCNFLLGLVLWFQHRWNEQVIWRSNEHDTWSPVNWVTKGKFCPCFGSWKFCSI